MRSPIISGSAANTGSTVHTSATIRKPSRMRRSRLLLRVTYASRAPVAKVKAIASSNVLSAPSCSSHDTATGKSIVSPNIRMTSDRTWRTGIRLRMAMAQKKWNPTSNSFSTFFTTFLLMQKTMTWSPLSIITSLCAISTWPRSALALTS